MSNGVAVGLLLVGLFIVVGFLSDYQFVRTGFPGILFLIFLGFLVGPMFNVAKPEAVTGLAPYLADVATILIMFEAGLTSNIQRRFREVPRALWSSILHLILCIVVGAVFMAVIGVDPLFGIVFGIMVSSNSAAVLALIQRSNKVREEVVLTIRLESTFNNIFQIVSFLALAKAISIGNWAPFVVLQSILLRFGLGGVIGFMAGLCWLVILSRIRGEASVSMLTLALLFIIYYAAESCGGDGAFASLLFGIILASQKEVGNFLRSRNINDVVIDEYLVRFKPEFLVKFESELCFLVRTFFFVYIGLFLNLSDPLWLVYGVIISLLLFFARIVAIRVATIRSALQREKYLISSVLARGINEAALTVVFLSYGFPYALMFQNIAFIVIIVTNILTAIGVYAFAKKRGR